MNNNNTPATDPLDIEEIMQEIRKKILAEQMQLGEFNEALVPLGGKRFSPQFYEHLYHAALSHNQIEVPLHVTKINMPVIGPILERLRAKLHTLVLFYVNQVAARQTAVNYHLLQAISLLSQELDNEEPTP